MRMSAWCTGTKTGVSLSILVVPRASRTEVQGEHGDALKIRLAAPPVDGAANEELIHFIAREVGVRRDAVTLTSGATSKRKVLAISGVTPDHVQERLRRGS